LEGLGLKEVASAAEAAERLAVLRGHRWSSYRSYAGYDQAPTWLQRETILERAGGRGAQAQAARYRADVERYVRGGYAEDWAARLRNGVAVGTETFLRRMKQGLRRINREWPGQRELRRRQAWADVMRAVAKVKGEAWAAFADRHGDWGRDLALRVARQCTGMTLSALGRAVGGLDYGAVSTAVRRMDARIQRERTIKAAFSRVVHLLNV
jgi:hypothetical protein